MKRIRSILVCTAGILLLGTGTSHAQAIKINVPLALVATPNIGAEFTVGRQLSVNADVLWAPYLFKKKEEVFRTLIGTVDFRYYINPKYYYTNNMFDGFYIGPYAMYGNFNIGLAKKPFRDKENHDIFYRYTGWGVSGGITLGYKMFLTERFRIDFNIAGGVVHMQYNKYRLGGEYADFPIERKSTKFGVYPTKLGIHLVYNIFR